MRKFLKCFSIMAIYLLITACPYESSVPLASPSEKLIPELLGKWIVHDGKGDHVVIKKLNTYQYQINDFKFDNDKREYISENYRAHSSTIDDEIFLNVSPAPKISSVDIHGIKSESYFLYKIKFQGADSLLLVEVSQYIREQFINSVELEAFVKKYKDLSFFFGEETLYIKDKE